jgi:hypothetical protein
MSSDGAITAKEVKPVGTRVRWLQALIILSALFGVLFVQSARPRQGVLTKVI